MKTYIQVILYLILLGIFFYHGSSYGDNNFGQIYIAVDGQDSLNLDVRTAFLYRNVDVRYDSTILIQNDEKHRQKRCNQNGGPILAARHRADQLRTGGLVAVSAALS